MFSRLKISRKIGFAFAALLLIAAGMGVTVWANITSVAGASGELEAQAELQLVAGDIRYAMTRQENSLRGYLITRDKTYVEKVEKHGKTQHDFLAQARAIAAGRPEVLAKLDVLETNLDAWYENIAKPAMTLVSISADPNEPAELITSAKADSYRDPAEELVDGLRQAQNEGFLASAATLANVHARSELALEIGLAGLLAAAVALGFGLARSIATPIKRLDDAMLRLARGDATVAVPSLERGDEIGSMARAVQIFKDGAVENQRLEAEAAASQSLAAASRERQAALDGAKAEDLRVFAHVVEASFERLSQGDLTVRMDAAVAAEFEPIRHRFNEAVGALEDAIGSVVGSIGSIRTGLGEITVAAGDLSQRTEQQAASLEETVAALGEVTNGVNGTAISAGLAQEAAQDAQKNAEKGGEIVANAVAAMSEIERSSDQIGKIIGVIDEIAFQTNLLALNAGVEAARAGEAGRGFAVVAQEVRGLAQRSAEAAKEIKDLISTSSAQVGRGVELVSASGRSLDGIVDKIAEMNRVVATIARSAQEQASSLREVSTAADQMDKVTQQNAAMVEETTAAAQTLSGETEELARLTERFRTKAAASAGWGRGAAAARPATAGAAFPRPAAAVAQMRAAGRGGAAPKPAAHQDEWEEF